MEELWKKCIISTAAELQIPIETVQEIILKKYPQGDSESTLKILSWNVNGIRSNVLGSGAISKGELCNFSDIDPKSNLGDLIETYQPDIVCLQETKCDQDTYGCIKLKNYYQYWNCSKSTGARMGSRYSGTGMWTKIKPNKVTYNFPGMSPPDKEGRIIVAEFDDFILINLYSPNSGSNFEYRTKVWDVVLKEYLESIKEEKMVVVCGDLNVSHREVDVFFSDPSSSRYSKAKLRGEGTSAIAGFTKQERENFGELLKVGYVDTFRHFHPDERKYTWWSQRIPSDRPNNKGMRLDYFLVNKKFIDRIKDSKILYHSGLLTKSAASDHAAIILELKL